MCILSYMLEAKVARYGNSLTVRLPAALARELELSEGDSVSIERVDHGLLLTRNPLGRLQKRLSTVRELEADVGTGEAVGAERFE